MSGDLKLAWRILSGALSLFSGQDNRSVVSLLNRSLVYESKVSDNGSRIHYHMTPEITTGRYDTYSLTSSHPDLVDDVVQELRDHDVSMIQMAYSDVAFSANYHIWHFEQNYLVYCTLKALNRTLAESRVNRLDFIGPRYRWLLLAPGSTREEDLVPYLQEGDNFAIIRPAKVSLKRQIDLGVYLIKEVVSNLTDLGYQYPGLTCRPDLLPRYNDTNNISLALNTELLEMKWTPFKIKTYVRLPAGNMGFKQVGDVTNRGVLRLQNFTSIVLWFSLNYYPGPADRKPSKNGWPLLSFVTWQTFGALMQQGMVEEPIVTSARVVVSMWWFYVIVVAGVYNGNLIAFLTAPTTHLPINSLTDLANSDMLFGTLRDAAFHGIIEKADGGLYGQLWNKVKDDVDRLFYDDPDEAMQRVLDDKKYAFVIEASYYTMLHIRNSTISKIQCQFARPKYNFFTNMYGFAFQKGSPYTSIFSMQ
ncbi:hypothetical protein LSH36_788g00015 [Paralvinella palmiformis]|uniref:Ionotropic glutamate receptor C-terminal domain-containing protein n=1 Tax=Paralvinella palmiformis TaxID=53620 RepID=A0AAD9MU00_9ANNE|nr:hypothetical protein LSH36_788g00015 [Paralvinella palmiformis]